MPTSARTLCTTTLTTLAVPPKSSSATVASPAGCESGSGAMCMPSMHSLLGNGPHQNDVGLLAITLDSVDAFTNKELDYLLIAPELDPLVSDTLVYTSNDPSHSAPAPCQ